MQRNLPDRRIFSLLMKKGKKKKKKKKGLCNKEQNKQQYDL